MTDPQWLRNLADAHLVGGEWRSADPSAVAEQVRRRLADAPHELLSAAYEYAQILSEVSGQRLNIHVLDTTDEAPADAQPEAPGFLLLLGRCQIALRQTPQGSLVATLTQLSGFVRRSAVLHHFVPEADQLGHLQWRMDNTLLLPTELIMKRLIEDLARATRGTGDAPEEG